MDLFVAGFSRVARNFEAKDQLIADFPALLAAARSSPSSLSALDKQRLLDLPSPDVQQAAIAALGGISKAELLQRAARSPRELTDAELDLLSLRYWRDYPTEAEKAAALTVHDLFGGDDDAWMAAYTELQAVRAPLYEDVNEAEALENAQAESSRRLSEQVFGGGGGRKEWEDKCLQTMALARPWVRRMWEEDGGFGSRRRWGVTYFVVPSVMEDERRADDYMSRVSGVFWWGKDAMACGEELDRRWEYQRLDWPESVSETRLRAADEDVDIALRMMPIKRFRDGDFDDSGDSAVSPQAEAPHEDRTEDNDDTADRARLETVQKLREHFVTLREEGKLESGMLPNAFIVVDQDCVDSTIGTMKGTVDWMWVWAVDPDYKTDEIEADAASLSLADDDQKPQVYRGFFRIRLQQLINNFYELRRFHAQEYSMLRLWQYSLRSRDKLFFSVKEEELRLCTVARDVGSAIRAPGRILRDQHGASMKTT